MSVIQPNVTTKKDTLKELDSKVSDRKDKLHEVLTKCEDSGKTLDDLLLWLRSNDKAMKSLKPMSENMDVLLQLHDFYEVCVQYTKSAKDFLSLQWKRLVLNCAEFVSVGLWFQIFSKFLILVDCKF